MIPTILRVSTYPTSRLQGMGLHPYELCKIEGFHTIFLAPVENDEREPLPLNTELVQRKFVLGARPRNASYVSRAGFLAKRLFGVARFSLAGFRILLSRQVEIVHLHSPMYWPIGFVGYILGKEVCITFHGTDFYRVKRSKIYKFGSFIFSRVFVISPDMVSDLGRIHGECKIVQAFNGVDRSSFPDKCVERSECFVAVGSLKGEKGFDNLIHAFAGLRGLNDDFKDTRLIIVGEGVLRESLEALIRKLGMTSAIELVGHKTHQELIDIYNDAKVFVLSSVSEGFPKVLLEAMSCGCAIVATKVGSVGDVLPGYRFLCEAGDIPDLAQKMAMCMNTFDWRSDSAALSEIVNCYTWGSVREIYERSYRDMV